MTKPSTCAGPFFVNVSMPLDGIIDASGGDGHALRDRLRRAVAQGMEKGHTTHQTGEFWRDLARRLDPATPGRNEKRF